MFVLNGRLTFLSHSPSWKTIILILDCNQIARRNSCWPSSNFNHHGRTPNVDLWPDFTLNLESNLDHKVKPQTEEVTINNMRLSGFENGTRNTQSEHVSRVLTVSAHPHTPPPPSWCKPLCSLSILLQSHFTLLKSFRKKDLWRTTSSHMRRFYNWTTCNYSVVGPGRPAIVVHMWFDDPAESDRFSSDHRNRECNCEQVAGVLISIHGTVCLGPTAAPHLLLHNILWLNSC